MHLQLDCDLAILTKRFIWLFSKDVRDL